jgi:hypothetical protein
VAASLEKIKTSMYYFDKYGNPEKTSFQKK